MLTLLGLAMMVQIFLGKEIMTFRCGTRPPDQISGAPEVFALFGVAKGLSTLYGRGVSKLN